MNLDVWMRRLVVITFFRFTLLVGFELPTIPITDKVAAGIFSALVSHIFAARILLPRMVANLAKNAASGAVPAAVSPILPSIGASGAIWASLMMTSLAWPHTTVTLVFLPFVPISIGTGVFGFIALDIVGLIRGWR